MTFDEAIKELERDGIFKDNGADLFVDNIIEQLRKEYAPTIGMTKKQVDELNSIIREVGEVFEPNEISADVKLTDKVIELESSYLLFKYLNAILHPETIKIIDE